MKASKYKVKRGLKTYQFKDVNLLFLWSQMQLIIIIKCFLFTYQQSAGSPLGFLLFRALCELQPWLPLWFRPQAIHQTNAKPTQSTNTTMHKWKMHKSTTKMQNQRRAKIQQCTNEKCKNPPNKFKTCAEHKYTNAKQAQKQEYRTIYQKVRKQHCCLTRHYCWGLVVMILA